MRDGSVVPILIEFCVLSVLMMVLDILQGMGSSRYQAIRVTTSVLRREIMAARHASDFRVIGRAALPLAFGR